MTIKYVVAAAATLVSATSVAAFTATRNPNSINTNIDQYQGSFSFPRSATRSPLFSTVPTTTTSAPCDIPEDVVPEDLVKQKGSASILRSLVLTNVDGDSISLGNLMGKGKSVVIFLRHMG